VRLAVATRRPPVRSPRRRRRRGGWPAHPVDQRHRRRGVPSRRRARALRREHDGGRLRRVRTSRWPVAREGRFVRRLPATRVRRRPGARVGPTPAASLAASGSSSITSKPARRSRSMAGSLPGSPVRTPASRPIRSARIPTTSHRCGVRPLEVVRDKHSGADMALHLVGRGGDVARRHGAAEGARNGTRSIRDNVACATLRRHGGGCVRHGAEQGGLANARLADRHCRQIRAQTRAARLVPRR
jgi:hypothetical protein